MIKQEILERALHRQKKARILAEQILESKSLELYNTAQELKLVNKKLEHLLDEKKSQLKGVFENINDTYLVIDLNGSVLKLNDIEKDFFGYDLNKEKVNFASLIFKEDYMYAINAFTELIEKGHFYNYTSRIINKKKEIKWVHINASVIYDDEKNAIAAQGIVRDITEEREKRLTLDLINNTAKSILGKEEINDIATEVSKSITTYLETNTCIIYLKDKANSALEKISSFNCNEIDTVNDLIVEDVANSGRFELIQNLKKDSRYDSENKKNKSKITIPIVSDGKVIGVIDAEHKSKKYFKIEHVNTIESIANLVALQLKSALNLRERKIAESKNTELLKKLEKSNEELQEYAHIVSHDLKSPLRSIAALTSWIKTDNINAFDETSLQYFKDLDITLETMENLISDVLDYSTLDADVSEDELVELNPLIENLINILYVPDNVSINILNTLPTIKGDKTKFQQLFQNLISNAIKFCDKKQGIVNIDVKDHNSFYQFSINDNGIGIQKKYFDSIFKIFQSLKKSKDSTGIGLSIVKKIVDIYNGEIWLESEVGIGTTFYFTIKK